MTTITKDTIIGDILDIAPETAPLFMAIGMHCLGCPSSEEIAETISFVTGGNGNLEKVFSGTSAKNFAPRISSSNLSRERRIRSDRPSYILEFLLRGKTPPHIWTVTSGRR